MLSNRVVPAIVLLLASTLVTAALAQEDPFEPIDPEELESLAIVQAEMMIAQQEAQQQIDEIIAESGIAYEEFLQMYYSMIGPDGEIEGDLDADVDEEFRELFEHVHQIERQADEEIEAAMAEVGMDDEQYSELSRVAAENTETANQLDSMVSELIRQQQMH